MSHLVALKRRLSLYERNLEVYNLMKDDIISIALRKSTQILIEAYKEKIKELETNASN